MRLINADALKIESQKRKEGIERYGEEQADCFYSAGRELSTEWWCVEDMIDNTPTVDVPERKVGKWKPAIVARNIDALECSECGAKYPNLLWMPGYSYCPNCGAKMGDDWEEPEINPCRGCDDYDGRGGCTSHGGCGAERSEEDEDWYTELDDPKIAERIEE